MKQNEGLCGQVSDSETSRKRRTTQRGVRTQGRTASEQVKLEADFSLSFIVSRFFIRQKERERSLELVL